MKLSKPKDNPIERPETLQACLAGYMLSHLTDGKKRPTAGAASPLREDPPEEAESPVPLHNGGHGHTSSLLLLLFSQSNPFKGREYTPGKMYVFLPILQDKL